MKRCTLGLSTPISIDAHVLALTVSHICEQPNLLVYFVVSQVFAVA